MLDLLTLLSLLVCVAAGAAQVSHWFYGDYLLTVDFEEQ